ncbi:MAG: single-stranded-DNA-specific exonuclease RecJ [Lachnospiraceae bacterium]|nr:single-stranded-DNA-specific exonuclease RecJ [Lachnospiraceae bacterium]
MRKEKWLVQAKKADFNTLGERWNISPVTARIIRNRNHTTDEEFRIYLKGNESDMHSPWLFKDMEKAVDILLDKIKGGKKIRVIGDYDIDGVCSTYILVDGLKRAGGMVSMDIPDRVRDGYGINEHLIQRAYDDGIDTIVTCDNGIAAIEQIAFAKRIGMTVIVTDHHEIPYVEERTDTGDIRRNYLRVGADATINPKQPDCTYPFKLLCGAGVAYKLIQALYEKMGKVPEEYIVFAAIATVGDVVDLKGENRIITKLGLKKIQQTTNAGLRALIEVNQMQEIQISSYHIGFVLGPCLNASGRLETAKLAFEMLNAPDETTARNCAEHLKELNDKRKALTEEGVAEALSEAEKYVQDKFQVLYLPDIHESIAGIIAGRVREKLNKPVIVLTKAEEGVKGSGRSIEGCNMFEELTGCRELLDKFGGHEMAAGLSLKEENVDRLRQMLNEKTKITEEDLIPKVWIDVPMPFEYISTKFIEELKCLEPFGKGNEKPVFAEKGLKISRVSVIGKNRDSLKLVLTNERGISMNALLFRHGEEFFSDLETKYGKEELGKVRMGIDNDVRLSVIYYPQINEYRGNIENQIVVNNYCF